MAVFPLMRVVFSAIYTYPSMGQYRHTYGDNPFYRTTHDERVSISGEGGWEGGHVARITSSHTPKYVGVITRRYCTRE